MEIQSLPDIIQLRHELHQHPELSNQEFWTKAYLIRFLTERTTLDIIDMGAYFYARYNGRSNEPAIAFRADFDALPINDYISATYQSQIPGVGHKCGHDGHAATLCALCLTVDKYQPERSCIFLFQPAEEIGEGAKQCLNIFEQENIGEFYAYHNYPGEPYQTVAIKAGTICLTSKGLNYQFQGLKSHASYPEQGHNPIFPISQITQFIEKLQASPEAYGFKGFIRVTIVHTEVGAADFGISPANGMMRLTIRAEYDEEFAQLEAYLTAFAKEQAAKYGCKVVVSDQEYFPATINDKESVIKVFERAQRIGQAIKPLDEFFRASEDFAYFLQRVPGAMIFMGDGEDYPVLHSVGFDFPDGIIAPMVAMFYSLIES